MPRRHQLIAMTKILDSRSFLLLLTASSLVSARRLLAVGEESLRNTTSSNYTRQYTSETELQTTGAHPQTTNIREEQSAALTPHQNTSEASYGQPSPGNATSGNASNVEGSETNSTQHQSAGNKSFVGTESPLQTTSPVHDTSSTPTIPSIAPILPASASVGPGNNTDVTNSSPGVVTTPDISPFGTSRTTLKPVVPTRTHRPNSTPNSDTSTTKVCPTAQAKGESLVGRCLIAIASLSALATIFIMTTIILATKLAGSRHRHRERLLHETEMVCISALMNDSDHPIPTPKHPKSNGALIPITDDVDGDNLTLNSFLHDTEGTA